MPAATIRPAASVSIGSASSTTRPASDVGLQGLRVADLETLNRGIEGLEPLMQPIGNVGETDRVLVVRGIMGGLGSMTNHAAQTQPKSGPASSARQPGSGRRAAPPGRRAPRA